MSKSASRRLGPIVREPFQASRSLVRAFPSRMRVLRHNIPARDPRCDRTWRRWTSPTLVAVLFTHQNIGLQSDGHDVTRCLRSLSLSDNRRLLFNPLDAFTKSSSYDVIECQNPRNTLSDYLYAVFAICPSGTRTIASDQRFWHDLVSYELCRNLSNSLNPFLPIAP